MFVSNLLTRLHTIWLHRDGDLRFSKLDEETDVANVLFNDLQVFGGFLDGFLDQGGLALQSLCIGCVGMLKPHKLDRRTQIEHTDLTTSRLHIPC